MKHTVLFGVLASAVVSSGCAFSNINMVLPTGSSVDLDVGKSREITVVTPFTDSRAISHRCGMQKNGYNMDTADATCDRSPTEWIANRLSAELRAAGFKVVEDSAPGAVRVQGTLLKLFVEPVIGTWTGSLEADLQVKLRVALPNGLVAEQTFFAKGIRAGQMMSITPAFEAALGDGTNTLMRDMVVAIGLLVDQYSTAEGAG